MFLTKNYIGFNFGFIISILVNKFGACVPYIILTRDLLAYIDQM